jgi:hypothetical protein
MITFTPWLILFVFLTFPIIARLISYKSSIFTIILELLLVFIWVVSSYIQGAYLFYHANKGDKESMFQYSRWVENHNERIGSLVLWPVPTDTLHGFNCLEKAAAMSHPEATYALGVRLKYGTHVPRPTNWQGPSGNHFPQPDLGQHYIDLSKQLGYEPDVDEQLYYRKEYRKKY